MTPTKNNSFPKICILGAGFSGICAGIRLKTKLGLDNFTIFDDNEDFGGTWLIHTYPECASDVPSMFYSYSFEPYPYWSQTFCRQPEILHYLKNCALKHDLYTNARFRHQVQRFTWIVPLKKWIIQVQHLDTGVVSEEMFDMIIMGPGGFRVPNIPEIFTKFRGPLIHSAKWDHSIDLKDKVVAVIGSGPSAIQIVPGIVAHVKKLYSFQRSPSYVSVRPQVTPPHFAQSMFARFPFLLKFWRMVTFICFEVFYNFLKKDSIWQSFGEKACQIQRWLLLPNNAALRKKLRPTYVFGCRRVCFSNSFYPALAQTHVEVVREPVTFVEDDMIVTEDGTKRRVDVVICATGYISPVQYFGCPVKLFVQNEDTEDVEQSFNTQFYLGTMTPGAPNLFTLLGPNSAPLHSSAIFPMECQMNWIVQVIQKMLQDGDEFVQIKEEAVIRYNQKLQEELDGLVIGGSSSCAEKAWFIDKATGLNNVALGKNLTSFWRSTRRVQWGDLNFV